MKDRTTASEPSASGSAFAPESEAEPAVRDLKERLASSEQKVEELLASLRDAKTRETVLRHELQHRVRNMLAVIRSIFRRTRENGATQDEFAEHLEGRIGAIARYQSALSDTGSSSIELEDIVRNELLDVRCSDGPMCTIAGPPVRLSDKAVELISLAVHELTTNSIKFGALAHRGGIGIQWFVDRPQDEAKIHLRWTESGVPIVATAPRARGFGQQLIEEALPYQLGAATSFDLKPGGLDCSIELPLSPPQAMPDISRDVMAEELPILPSELE